MNPLLTDHYQMTMSYAYWRNGRHNDHAIFEAFFRKAPFKGKFTIFAGIDEVTDFISQFRFTESHIHYLRSVMPGLPDQFFEFLSNLDTSNVQVHGIQDGHIVFPREPLLRLEGPLLIL